MHHWKRLRNPCHNYIIFDIDVRGEKPSTDQDTGKAIKVAEEICKDPRFEGAGICMIGNGASVVALLGFSADLETRQRQLRALFHELNDKYRDLEDTVEIDLKVHNPARLMALMGAKKMKGEEKPNRPHRVARFIREPRPERAQTLMEAISRLTPPPPLPSSPIPPESVVDASENDLCPGLKIILDKGCRSSDCSEFLLITMAFCKARGFSQEATLAIADKLALKIKRFFTFLCG